MPKPRRQGHPPTPPMHPLRRWREAHGVSQRELGRQVGVTQPMICQIEGYKNLVLGETLEKLLVITRLPTDAFVRPQRFLAEHPEFPSTFGQSKPARAGRPRKVKPGVEPEKQAPSAERFGWKAGDRTITHPDGSQESV